MVSEAKRGAIRLLANYGQLFANILLGFWLIRLLVQGLGNEGFGLVGLLGSTVGISAMVQEIVRQSMIRELGAAHHDKNPQVFIRTYNAALLLCLGAAVVMCVLFGVLLAVLPVLNISADMLPAARWLVVAYACRSACVVVLAPPRSMYLVTERMIFVSFWNVLETAGRTVAAGLVIFADTDPMTGLILYGALSVGIFIVIQMIAAGLIVSRDRRLVPKISAASADAIRSILHLGGWNVVMLVAANLHSLAGAIIMNLVFGVAFGNTIWSLAERLTMWARNVVAMAARGSDAVAARMSATRGRNAVQRLLYHSTRVYGVVAFPCALLLGCLAEPCLQILVGSHVQNPQAVVPAAVVLVWIVLAARTCDGLARGWFRIFYGAGLIRHYAPWVLTGALLNPVLAVIFVAVLPSKTAYTAAAWAYLIAVSVFSIGLACRGGARAMGVTYRQLLAPLLRPLIVAGLGAPVLLVAVWQVSHWRLWTLAVVGLLYAAVHVLLVFAIVMSGDERRRVTGVVFRWLGVAATSRIDG